MKITDLLEVLSEDWDIDILDANYNLIISTYGRDADDEMWLDFLIHFGNAKITSIEPAQVKGFIEVITNITE